jgi:hypothetical protein
MLLAGSQDPAATAGAAALREARVWRNRLLLALLLALPVAVLSMLAMHPELQQKLEGPHGWGQQHTAAAATVVGGDTAGAFSPTGYEMSGESSMPAAGVDGPVHVATAAGLAPGKAVGGLPILWIVQLVLATGACCF